MSKLSFVLLSILAVLALLVFVPSLTAQARPGVRGVPAGADVADPGAEMIVTILALQYAVAHETQPAIMELCRHLPRKFSVIADGRTNSLLIQANAKDTERIKGMVAALDRQVKKAAPKREAEIQVNVMILEHRRAENVGGVIREILQSNVPQRMGRGARVSRNSSIRVVIDRELNALVTYTTAKNTARVRDLVAALDRPIKQKKSDGKNK
ncbi:MAG: hypothetical protein CMJ83_14500 [Planctomycetes bacterium]|nr:hypothetical protein [Planctomycetota bacterium]